MNQTLSISSDHPSLPGHFPGQPVVPGVVILQRVRRQLRALHPHLTPTGIKKLKFLGILKPGEAFCIDFADFKNGGIRFKCYAPDDHRILADGHLTAISDEND